MCCYAVGQIDKAERTRWESSVSDDIKQKLTRQAKTTLEKAKQAAKAVLELKSLIEASDTPAETTIDTAPKPGSSPGKKGIARFVLGSVAQKVVSYAPCSVLVVL